MSISFQKKTAPLDISCCLFPFQNRTQLSISTSLKVFQSNKVENNYRSNENTKNILEKKQSIQSMKKSISSISFKHKLSEGHRPSINQSQFIFKTQKPQKRLVTYSMDSQLLKTYLPYNQKDFGICKNIQQIYNQKNNKQQYQNQTKGLNQLAQKFKKSRQVRIQQFIEKTKKDVHYKPSNQGEFQMQNLQKTSVKQFSRNPKQNTAFTKNLEANFNKNQIQLRSPQKQSQSTNNPQGGKQSSKKSDLSAKNRIENYHSKINMSQVDSMIIEINSTQKNQKLEFPKRLSLNLGSNREITKSGHFESSQTVKANNKQTKKYTNLANYSTITVKSDFEEDGQERAQKMEQSAIIINYFNPPSFIRQKFTLSTSQKI